MALKPIGIQSVSRFICLVIGEAGVGKTSLLRTLPENERACVLSAESGLLCVRDLVQSGQVEGFEISSFTDMKEAYQMLLSNKEMQERYQYIFIDSLTEISGRCVEAMQAKYPSKSDSFAMWGDYNATMTQLIKGFRDMQAYSVIFTCLPSVEKDEANRRYIGPAISGSQLKERLTSYFDEVFYMTVERNGDGDEDRSFITQPYGRMPGKDRSGKLDAVEIPDLKHIKTKILNGIKEV